MTVVPAGVQEAAQTVADVGIVPFSAAATAQRQLWVADRAVAGRFRAGADDACAADPDWRVQADRILARLRGETTPSRYENAGTGNPPYGGG